MTTHQFHWFLFVLIFATMQLVFIGAYLAGIYGILRCRVDKRPW